MSKINLQHSSFLDVPYSNMRVYVPDNTENKYREPYVYIEYDFHGTGIFTIRDSKCIENECLDDDTVQTLSEWIASNAVALLSFWVSAGNNL